MCFTCLLGKVFKDLSVRTEELIPHVKEIWSQNDFLENMCILSELDPFFTDFKSNFTKFLDYVGECRCIC